MSSSKAGGGGNVDLVSSTGGLMLVSFLCGLTFTLSVSAVCVPWTSYKVAVDSDELAELVNTSKKLGVLFGDWPQLFYDRERHLTKVCFLGIDDRTWLLIFGQSPCCRRNNRNNLNNRENRKGLCYCMENHDYDRPSDTSNVTVAVYAVKSEADDIRTQKKLVDASFGLTIIVLVLSFGLTLSTLFVTAYPKSVGTVTLIIIIIVECAIVAAVAMFCVADNMEHDLIQPPHYGFIRNNTMLSSLTSKSRTHGFRLACSAVVTATLMLVFYVWSWCTHLCEISTMNSPLSQGGSSTLKPADYVIEEAPAVDDRRNITAGGNIALDNEFASKEH